MSRRREWFEDLDNMPPPGVGLCQIIEIEARRSKGEARRNFGAAARACRSGNNSAMVNYLINGGASQARGRHGWDLSRDYAEGRR
ncbi:MAG: hypothetical protein ABH877_02495 [bacterium]